MKPRFELKVLYNFKRTDFYPVPQVDIVLLQIKKLSKPLIKEEKMQDYKDFIAYVFSQRKPNLKEILSRIFTHEQFKRLSHDLKFQISAIPSDLDFQQWLGLFNYFLVGVDNNKKTIIKSAEEILKKQQVQLHKIHRTRNF